jgi:hypothetical protein
MSFFKWIWSMELPSYEQALYSLELACQYFSQSPSDTNVQQLKFYLKQAYIVCIESNINLRFMYSNNTFQEAWNLFTSYQEPVSQHRSNVVYLSDRLPLS